MKSYKLLLASFLIGLSLIGNATDKCNQQFEFLYSFNGQSVLCPTQNGHLYYRMTGGGTHGSTTEFFGLGCGEKKGFGVTNEPVDYHGVVVGKYYQACMSNLLTAEMQKTAEMRRELDELKKAVTALNSNTTLEH